MINSLAYRITLESYYTDSSPDPIRTIVHYRLLNYLEISRYRSGLLEPQDLYNVVTKIINVKFEDQFYKEVTDRETIYKILSSMDPKEFSLFKEQVVTDSVLSPDEVRKLEYLTYYFNWKADEPSRRKSYNCDDCIKFNYIKSRFCFLEHEKFELPDFEIVEDENGNKKIEDLDPKEKSLEDFLDDLNRLSEKEPELSLFEIGLKYFSKIMDDERPGIFFEVCPESIKMNSLDLAEIFEMENRSSEYHVLPVNGGQFEQPFLLLQAFDVIRGTRNFFHSQKMKEVKSKNG